MYIPYDRTGLLYYFSSIFTNYLICPHITYPGKEVGLVTDPQINEASGLVASQTYPDVFWTLNDSDGPNCIYAIGELYESFDRKRVFVKYQSQSEVIKVIPTLISQF